MVELPMAAAEVFPENISLLDFSNDPKCSPNFRPAQLFQEIFDASFDVQPGLAVDGEEEELEWLANKDAFPSLETSFDPASSPPFRPPSRARSGGRRRRRKDLPTFGPLTVSEKGKKGEKRKCRHCEAEETPQWRLGPEGPKTLCNACGVRYNSGRLVPEYRPANSPTFSAAIHSNSHRRVMEMRRQKNGGVRRGWPRVRPAPLVAGLAGM